MNCPICDSTPQRSFTSIADDSGLCAAGHPYSYCQGCNYYFIDPQPKPDAMRRFYNEHPILSVQDSFNDALASYRQAGGRWAKISEVLPRTGGAYLDFGCNIGLMLHQNRDRFSSVYGVEINAEAAAFAASELAINTISPSLDAVPAGVRFNLISLIDVIEHVPDPGALIVSLRNRLTDDGLIFMRLPVIDGLLFSPTAPERWKFVYAPYHLSMFSVKALQALAKNAGLSCTITMDPSMHMQPAALAARMDSYVPQGLARTRGWRMARAKAAAVAMPLVKKVSRATSDTVFATLCKG